MSETPRTDGIIDDLVWCGRQLYHYEQPMMLPLSEESFRCYETARQMIERYRRALAAERERADRNQAMIDRLMLEYCPDEMTKEQLDNWCRHQQAAPDAARRK